MKWCISVVTQKERDSHTFIGVCLVIHLQEHPVKVVFSSAVKDLPEQMKLILLDFSLLNLGLLFLLIAYVPYIKWNGKRAFTYHKYFSFFLQHRTINFLKVFFPVYYSTSLHNQLSLSAKMLNVSQLNLSLKDSRCCHKI